VVRGHAGRQLQLGHVHGGTDFQTGQIDDDLGRDVVGGAGHFDFVQLDADHAAALDARGLLGVGDVHRHLDVHDGVGRNAQEVDVLGLVGDGVELDVASEATLLRAITQVDVEQAGLEARLVQLGPDDAGVEGDGDGGLLGTVNHTRNLAFTASGTGGPLSGPIAQLGDDGADLSHSVSP